MSHSQFHSIDLFILRHAWLNLWDKHMTTGRINQVSYRCNYLLQPTSRRRPLKASISETCFRLGGYALTSITRSRP
jgi:hypothetical protein